MLSLHQVIVLSLCVVLLNGSVWFLKSSEEIEAADKRWFTE